MSPVPALDDPVAERYLRRIGLADARASATDLATLQRAHLATVPFENLDIVFAGGVPHDLDAAVAKIVDRRRGGWCFESNGAFATLLVTVGFEVRLLGAAVLLAGPNRILDHLVLEVSGGVDDLPPHLVDVGFGDSFVDPLPLNRRGPLAGRGGDPSRPSFEYLAGAEGTTLVEWVDGYPEPRFRFRRVAHDHADFADTAERLRTDPHRNWARTPFATRSLDPVPGGTDDRVWLNHDRFRIRRDGRLVEDRPVEPGTEWDHLLATWFEMSRPVGPGS